MSELVSIIVPVYNTKEDMLKPCINSLCKQTYKNIEIILIDDGSYTATKNACELLQELDSRIRVKHVEHGGVSKARNIGTREAKGSYIMYMDSDDLLASFAVEEGMNAASRYNADYIMGALKRIFSYNNFEDGLCISNIVQEYTGKDVDYVKKAFITQRVHEFKSISNEGFINRGPCARLIKSNIAKNVHFDEELVLGEDVEWNMRVLTECNTVCFIPNVWYGYYIYPNSSLNKYYGNRAELLETYHQKLYERNSDYFANHLNEYGANLAISFYKMLVCEFMAPQCPLSKKEKRKTVKHLLNKDPWRLLRKKDVFEYLTWRYKILIVSCNLGLEFELLKLWKSIK